MPLPYRSKAIISCLKCILSLPGVRPPQQQRDKQATLQSVSSIHSPRVLKLSKFRIEIVHVLSDTVLMYFNQRAHLLKPFSSTCAALLRQYVVPTNNFLHKPCNVLSINVPYIYTSKRKIINMP